MSKAARSIDEKIRPLNEVLEEKLGYKIKKALPKKFIVSQTRPQFFLWCKEKGQNPADHIYVHSYMVLMPIESIVNIVFYGFWKRRGDAEIITEVYQKIASTEKLLLSKKALEKAAKDTKKKNKDA